MKINGKPNKYTFNLADNKKQTKGVVGSGHDFEKMNRGFYDELEEQDYLLKEGKQGLRKIKKQAIKECVYTNKIVPSNWKNKLNYQNDLLKIFEKDERFVAYLGKGGSVETTIDFKPNQTCQSALPKLRNTHSGKDSFSISDKNDDNENGTRSIKPKYTATKKTNELSEKEILNILEDFRNAYPINKSETDNMNKTMTTQAGTNGWLSLRHMKIDEKQEMFKKSIYTNLLPPANTLRAKSSIPKVKKFEEKKTDYGPFLNFDYEAYNKKVEITNPTVKKHLEAVNYFGPYYAHCPSCSNRNLEFYQNMEPNQCVDLLKQIKKIRGRTAVIKGKMDLSAKM